MNIVREVGFSDLKRKNPLLFLAKTLCCKQKRAFLVPTCHPIPGRNLSQSSGEPEINETNVVNLGSFVVFLPALFIPQFLLSFVMNCRDILPDCSIIHEASVYYFSPT
jgi:hypothetical protein